MPFFWDQSHYHDIAEGLRLRGVEAEAWGLGLIYGVVIESKIGFANAVVHGGTSLSPTVWTIYQIIEDEGLGQPIEPLGVAYDAPSSAVIEAIWQRLNPADEVEQPAVDDARAEVVSMFAELRSAVDAIGAALLKQAALAVEIASTSAVAPAASYDASADDGIQHLASHFKVLMGQLEQVEGDDAVVLMKRTMIEFASFIVNAHSRLSALEARLG